jgi:hypothetical protein
MNNICENSNHLTRGLLNLKFKVPHHLAQRLINYPHRSEDCSEEGAPLHTPDLEEKAISLSAKSSETHRLQGGETTEICAWLLSHSNLMKIVCVVCLLPLMIIDFPSLSYINLSRGQIRGCVFLMISPITNSGLLIFNLYHRNSKLMTMCLAIKAVLWSNAAGIAYCSSSCFSPSNSNQGINQIGQVCLSLALITAAIQLLMLMSKTNIPIVMISTASGVMVCSLSLAALFLPATIGKRCYQSTIPCILWLFWHASHKNEA